MPLSTHEQSDRLTVMGEVAREAGALALDYFHSRDSLQIETKRALTDMVSIADREVEELIRARLLARFPDDAFLGEEYGLRDGRSGLTWVVDPIDGTAPFLNGLPGWCVSIGLMDAQGPLLGAIHAPVLDEMFLGGRGQGMAVNGKPAQITRRFDLSTGLLGIGSNDQAAPDRLARLHRDLSAEGIAQVRYGSGALMLAFVAAGRLVGYCEPRMSLWDCCAAYALIEGAGGRVAAIGADAFQGWKFGVLGSTRDDYDRLAALTRFEAPDWDPAPDT
ncbi:inositol monophosphatase family protein [Paracoccus tegillarcae]|uniref:Inositol-1-monophosphatase n=1 Tax=Paracoccus tegillarcae TaxID=1529068 RepID=A0A2K9EQM3_9RHOB|nr:inositol monophosphatase [Paracoccus tegillarcae]AUH33046.1 inositol monophosphatase [Paracoccus tegillarcae]